MSCQPHVDKLVDTPSEVVSCTFVNSNVSASPNNSTRSATGIPVVTHDVWGCLRREGGNKDEYDLYHRVKDNRRDTFIIGRNKALSDIVVSNKLVSSKHCQVYCDYSEVRLRIFVEDCSVNGTFINDSLTRLSKGERTELLSGDIIYLYNPRVPDTELVKACAFSFINIRDRRVACREIGLAPTATSVTQSISDETGVYTGPGMRHIEDFYIIGKQIGQGVSGQVCYCVNRMTNHPCAVKIIDTRNYVLAGPGVSIDDVKEEAEIMKQFDHPNIIKVLDTFQSPQAIYIVMELVKGGDLFDRIVVRGKYTEDLARKVMMQLFSAVHCLHKRGIIHRDLKPENVLLVDADNDVNVKITDFGLAKKASCEGLKTFCGTPQYFAPEVLKRQNSLHGVGRYGTAADMWSLGVILFILLSGSFPFDVDNLFEQIELGQYSLSSLEWAEVSMGAKHLVRSLMTLRPDQRLTVTQALKHPWLNDVSFPAFPTASSGLRHAAIPRAAVENKAAFHSDAANVKRININTMTKRKAERKSSPDNVSGGSKKKCLPTVPSTNACSTSNDLLSILDDTRKEVSSIFLNTGRVSNASAAGNYSSVISSQGENGTCRPHISTIPLFLRRKQTLPVGVFSQAADSTSAGQQYVLADVYSVRDSQQDIVVNTVHLGQQDKGFVTRNSILGDQSTSEQYHHQQQQQQTRPLRSPSVVDTRLSADVPKSRRQSGERNTNGIGSASAPNKSRTSAPLPSSVVIATKDFSDDEIVEDCSSDENGSNLKKTSAESVWRHSDGEVKSLSVSAGNKKGRKRTMLKSLTSSKVDPGQSLLTDSWSKVSSVAQPINTNTESLSSASLAGNESYSGRSSVPLSKLRASVNSWSDMFKPVFYGSRNCSQSDASSAAIYDTSEETGLKPTKA